VVVSSKILIFKNHQICFFSVFWDLYSAAPERRDQHPHSEEAKAFHDYVRDILI
jgi:hypothetical protein